MKKINIKSERTHHDTTTTTTMDDDNRECRVGFCIFNFSKLLRLSVLYFLGEFWPKLPFCPFLLFGFSSYILYWFCLSRLRAFAHWESVGVRKFEFPWLNKDKFLVFCVIMVILFHILNLLFNSLIFFFFKLILLFSNLNFRSISMFFLLSPYKEKIKVLNWMS